MATAYEAADLLLRSIAAHELDGWLRDCRDQGMHAARIAQELFSMTGYSVSDQTVRRWLADLEPDQPTNGDEVAA